MGWQGSAPFYVLAKENSAYPIKKLMNGATGNGTCYDDVDLRLQPCDLHYSLSMCTGHAICAKLSDVTEDMAGKYIVYPWAMENISRVQVIVHIKGKIQASSSFPLI